MKKFLILIYISICTSTLYSQSKLVGNIYDSKTGESLPGATVFIPELKIGAISNANGVYELRNLPKNKFLVQVSFLGYASVVKTVNIDSITTMDFALAESNIEAQEITVTGSSVSSENSKSSISVIPLSRTELISMPATNIINALASIPGISEVSTGGAVSKPVIRGLGYNHVVTLNEGVRQEGNQWGDEHGIEIDQFSADRIEILKGPASLFYGSDAMGGVINILEPIPAPYNSIRGEATSVYATNANSTMNSLRFEGNNEGIIWHAQGSYKNSAAYKTPIETVYNSGSNELNFNSFLGINKGWGYSHIYFSRYDAFIGSIEGKRDPITNKFVDSQGNIVPDSKLNSRTLDVPFQNVIHTRVTSISNFLFGPNSLKLNLGFQTNDRKEYPESKTEPGLYFHLNTLSYDAKYYLRLPENAEFVTGISGMLQNNLNKGNEFLVPDYNLTDGGLFVYFKKELNAVSFNAGARYDIRFINSQRLDTLFNKFSNKFLAFSGSMGMTWKISNTLNLKLNVGRGFRAPNIAELASNGIHEGTFRYEKGNQNLKPETSLQFDGEISANYSFVNASLSLFYNMIDNYIFQQHKNLDSITINKIRYPEYYYVQGNSVLYGGEASIDMHFVDQMHFENTLAYVRGINESTNISLPLIPATTFTHTLKWKFKNEKTSNLKNTYVSLGISNHLKQNHIDTFETTTLGYVLLNASIGGNVKFYKNILTFFINGNNLTNTTYFDHLNRLKYLGISNMGRNISFGINIPFGITGDI